MHVKTKLSKVWIVRKPKIKIGIRLITRIIEDLKKNGCFYLKFDQEDKIVILDKLDYLFLTR